MNTQMLQNILTKSNKAFKINFETQRSLSMLKTAYCWKKEGHMFELHSETIKRRVGKKRCLKHSKKQLVYGRVCTIG